MYYELINTNLNTNMSTTITLKPVRGDYPLQNSGKIINPEWLLISQDLVSELAYWAASFDLNPNLRNPVIKSEGRQLINLLKSELPEYKFQLGF
jgi:hypothetical protein